MTLDDYDFRSAIPFTREDGSTGYKLDLTDAERTRYERIAKKYGLDLQRVIDDVADLEREHWERVKGLDG